MVEAAKIATGSLDVVAAIVSGFGCTLCVFATAAWPTARGSCSARQTRPVSTAEGLKP